MPHGDRIASVKFSLAERLPHKKRGYHGGATPQEVLVPLAVLVPQHRTLAGWEALPDRAPAWWSQGELPDAEVSTMPARTTRRARQATAIQVTLFAEAEGGSAEEPHIDWIEPLLRSPIFAAQRRAAGRRAPDDQCVRVLLATLEAHQDRLAHRVLEQGLGAPTFRLRGILAGVQRLLNVDGYQVLVVDDISGTVALNRQLLKTQFQLDGA